MADDDQAFVIKANPQYQISDVEVDGKSIGAKHLTLKGNAKKHGRLLRTEKLVLSQEKNYAIT